MLLVVAGCAAPPTVSTTSLELLANIDDDDGDAVRDGLDERANDLDDLGVVKVTSGCQSRTTVSIEPSSAVEHVHVFVEGALVAGGRRAVGEVPCGTQQLFVEALRTRSQLWDGRVRLVVRNERGERSVDARVAPVLFPDVTWPVTRVYAVDVSDADAGANGALLAALHEARAPLTLAPGAEHHFERWMQDAISAGVQRLASGVTQEVLLEMDRPTGARGLERFAASRLGPGCGLARAGRDETTVLSYGGNLETIPPHAGFPLGRLVIGGDGARHMGASTRAWLEAQEAQGPLLELPTAWLDTGHVDEVVAFLPVRGGWAMVVPSPALAWERLEWLERHGQGATTVQTGDGARTVSALLHDAALRRFNDEASVKLARVVEVLEQSTGQRVVPLPQLYEPAASGLARALTAPVVNLVSLGATTLVASSEVFDPLVKERLLALGLTPRFVDAAAYHAFGGGLHCGVELQRRAPR